MHYSLLSIGVMKAAAADSNSNLSEKFKHQLERPINAYKGTPSK
jgi:hypothetical protein